MFFFLFTCILSRLWICSVHLNTHYFIMASILRHAATESSNITRMGSPKKTLIPILFCTRWVWSKPFDIICIMFPSTWCYFMCTRYMDGKSLVTYFFKKLFGGCGYFSYFRILFSQGRDLTEQYRYQLARIVWWGWFACSCTSIWNI